jgi:hypothetical protein
MFVLTKNTAMKLKIFLLTMVVFFTAACKSDDDGCTSQTITTTSLEAEYGCVNTKNQMDIALNDDFVVITTQSGFDSQVTGTCQPEIDFTMFDLVIGKKALTSGNTSITYELVKNCALEELTLTVTFNQNSTTEAPNLTYHRLIPKLTAGETISVDIQID